MILAKKGHSQYCEWPSLARITQTFYSINSLLITHSSIDLFVFFYMKYLSILIKLIWAKSPSINCDKNYEWKVISHHQKIKKCQKGHFVANILICGANNVLLSRIFWKFFLNPVWVIIFFFCRFYDCAKVTIHQIENLNWFLCD